jgi:hypothetical protein
MNLEWARRVRDLAGRIAEEGGDRSRHAELVRMVGAIESVDPFDLDRAAMSLLLEVPVYGQVMKSAGRTVDPREHGVGIQLAVYSASLQREEARQPLSEMFLIALRAVIEAKAEGNTSFVGFGSNAARTFAGMAMAEEASPAP